MEILILLILILLNGILALSEIAIVSAKKSKLNAAVKRGDIGAKTALKLAENPSRFLSTVQIGITLIGILTGVYSGENLTRSLEMWLNKLEPIQPHSHSVAVTIVVVAITFFSLVLGELVPKRIGLAMPETIAGIMSKPMFLLSRITAPFIWLLSNTTEFIVKLFGLGKSTENQVTEEEIKAIISEGTEAGAIEEIEQDIVENVFHMGDRRIRSLMTPRIDVVWLNVDDSNFEIKEKIKASVHTIFPVAEGDVDKILGVVFVKDLLASSFDKEDVNLRKHLKTPLFIPENIKAFKVLEKFKESKMHFAVVLNEFGGVSGIATMNDLLETLVNDVDEEYENDKEIVERADGSYLIDASIPFPDFLRYFEVGNVHEEELNQYNTLGGLVFNLSRSIPQVGAKFVWKGFHLEVLDMDGRRIDKVLVSKPEEPTVILED